MRCTTDMLPSALCSFRLGGGIVFSRNPGSREPKIKMHTPLKTDMSPQRVTMSQGWHEQAQRGPKRKLRPRHCDVCFQSELEQFPANGTGVEAFPRSPCSCVKVRMPTSSMRMHANGSWVCHADTQPLESVVRDGNFLPRLNWLASWRRRSAGALALAANDSLHWKLC